MTSFGPRREVDPRATRFAQELMRVGLDEWRWARWRQ